MIRTDPAGWSYKDWEGVVYPTPRPKGFHEATDLAHYFDRIGIKLDLLPVTGAPDRKELGDSKLFRGFTHE